MLPLQRPRGTMTAPYPHVPRTAKKLLIERVWPRVLLLVCLLEVLSVASYAAGECSAVSFRTGVRVPAGIGPAALVARDFNGDGHLDLAAANYQSGDVSILLGDSANGFASPTNYPVGKLPVSISAGDFNGDGKLDLVTANNDSANISVLLGAGGGAFGAAVNYATAGSPYGLAVGDFNGDNLSDIAVGSSGSSNTVAILLSNGAGGFDAVTPVSAGSRVYSITVGKFNADEVLDLALGMDNLSAVFIGNGSGGFSQANSLPAGLSVKAAADFNGDGKADLIAANGYSIGISVLLGDGAGNFSSAGLFSGNPGGGIAVGDFNADGKNDAAALGGDASVSILAGDGAGQLGAPVEYTVGNWATGIISADFNADGKLDLAAASRQDAITVLYGTTGGGFAGSRNFEVGSRPDEIAVADFNGDGKDDLAVVNTNSLAGDPGASSISVLLGDGAGQMSPAPTIQFQKGVTVLTSLVAADFNNDGKADLAVSAGGDFMHGVNVMLGNGNGTFATPTNIGLRTNGGSPYRLITADFNADGNADMVVSFIHAGGFATLIGTGAGTFGVVHGYSLGSQNLFEDFAAGDFNGDGKLDLVFPRYHDKLLIVLLGNGNGNFSTKIDLALPNNPLTVIARDFNGDGKADMAYTAATGFTNYHVSVRLGDGTGNFGAATNYPVGDYPQSITAADFDGDGKTDLATSDSQSEQVSVLSGDGAGGFGLSVHFVIGGYPSSSAAADFNRDGKVDLAVSRLNANSVTILLNDFSARRPCLSVDDVTIAEGNAGETNATFNVTLSETFAQPVRVNFRVEPRYVYIPVLMDGVRPTEGVDYQPASGTLIFAPGTTTQTISVAVNGDLTDEYDEAFSVILSSPTNAVIHDALGVGTILDDDAPPTVSIDDSTVVEGTALFPPKTTVFNVTLTAASAKPIQVQFQTANGTATASSDYQVYTNSLNFAPGTTAKTITIEITGDTTHEPDETFFVNLSSVVNANAGDVQGQGTILNDDPVPTISIAASQSIPEGNAGATDNNISVQLSNPTYQTVTVNYATADMTATAGSDYTATSGSLTFNPGETSKPIKVSVAGDLLDEINETFTVTLSGAGNATMGAAQCVATIRDDDGPAISINDVSVLEGDSGLKNATFTVTLSAVSPQNVHVGYTANGGTATGGNDYVRVFNSSVQIPAGQISATFNLQIIGDFRLESDETFNVTLFNPFDGTIADSLGVGTILNDDAAGTLQFSASSYNVNENSAAAVSVERVGGRSGIVSVTFSTADGTATAGSDYTAVSQTVTFADGDVAAKTITIPLTDDSVAEAAETINLTLANPTNGAVLGSPAAAVLTVQDNESCNYSISPTGRTSPAAGETLTVNVTAQGGCAWAAVSNSNFISVASGASGAGDGVVTLTVLSNGSGVPRTGTATIAGQTFTVTQPEVIPSASTIQFNGASYQFTEGAGGATLTVTRTGDATAAASADYRTTDSDTFTVGCADATNNQGGAYARCDFATAVGTLTFAPGETSKTITVPLIDDGHVEGSETFQLRLSNISGAISGTPDAATVTITDNDAAGAQNPILTHPFFVRQQYLDFLSREPDADGFNAWLGLLNNCPNAFNGPLTLSGCDRIYVSGEGFFRSLEFQLKGGYVFRFYRVAFDRLPEYLEIVSDMSFVAGQTAEEVYARKAQLATLFAERAEFKAAYAEMTNAQYVNALLGRYNLTHVTTPDPANPDGAAKVTLTAAELTNRLAAGTLTRAQALRAVADSEEVAAAEFHHTFVGMQYYGYLRRKPDADGFRAWLGVLQNGGGRIMVDGFLNSVEYKLRFGQP
jgi:hypothetical protein